MSMVKIGLKLANGEFYPVLEDGVPARKRLVVTTVEDGQRSVQIDLYRGNGKTVHDAAYIGSIVIEDIPEGPKGEPDIRLEFSLDGEGNLAATAEETATGERRSLNVSLESFEEEKKYEIPDFSFEEEEPDSLPREATVLHETAAWRETEAEKAPAGRGLRVALVAGGILLLVLLAAFLVWFFALRDRGEAVPVAAVATTLAPASSTTLAAAAVTTTTSTTSTTTTTTSTTTSTLAPKPAATPAKVAATPAAGTKYRIRWGDTLWDLAFSYYGNPWLYPRIAKANGIRDPDLIISGTTIAIPPR